MASPHSRISIIAPGVQHKCGEMYNHFSAGEPSGLPDQDSSMALMFEAAASGQMNSDPTHGGMRRSGDHLDPQWGSPLPSLPHTSTEAVQHFSAQRSFRGPYPSGPFSNTYSADLASSSRRGTAAGVRPPGRKGSVSQGAWRRSQFGCEKCGVFYENSRQFDEHLQSKKHSAKEAK